MDKAKKKLGVTPSHVGQAWGRKHSGLDRDQLGRVRRRRSGAICACADRHWRAGFGLTGFPTEWAGPNGRETPCTRFAGVVRFGKPEPIFFPLS